MRSSSRGSATTSSAPAATTCIVQDNGVGDSFAGAGAINFAGAAFGYTFLVNTSQSKPMVGSATAPQLDLNFTATSNGTAGNVFLYASDIGFTLRRRVGAAHARRHQFRRERNRHRPRLGRHEQYRVPVLGREPHQLASSA